MDKNFSPKNNPFAKFVCVFAVIAVIIMLLSDLDLEHPIVAMTQACPAIFMTVALAILLLNPFKRQ